MDDKNQNLQSENWERVTEKRKGNVFFIPRYRDAIHLISGKSAKNERLHSPRG